MFSLSIEFLVDSYYFFFEHSKCAFLMSCLYTSDETGGFFESLFPVCSMSFFSGHFEDVLFRFGVQPFDYDVPKHDFLCIYLYCGLLRFWNL